MIPPGQVGRVEFGIGVIVRAYDLRPGQLYFVEMTMKVVGVPEPVTLVAPFGYAPARKD